MKTVHFRGGPLDGKKRRQERLSPMYRVHDPVGDKMRTTAYRLEYEKSANGRMVWVYVATASAMRSLT